MKKIAMLLSNAFRPDPRVLKEAESLKTLSENDITIICWDREKEFQPFENLKSGVKLIRIQTVPSRYGIGLRQMFRLFSYWSKAIGMLRGIQPDIIHCHDFDTLPAGLWYGKTHRIPVIYDTHEYYAEMVRPRLKGFAGRLLYYFIKWIEEFGAHWSSAVVTVDEKLATLYRRRNSKVIVLGHYPVKSFVASANSVFTHPTLTMIYTGRLSVDRGLFIYADMLEKLLEKRIPVRLLLVGVYTPESEKSRFYGYAKSLLNNITDVGWIPFNQISQYYQQADIGLAVLLPEPRYVAALPVKLFEYMANGLPVIASNFPATADLITSSNCGLLVDPQADKSATIDTIAQWWHTPASARILGENGRQAILSKYNWESQIIQLGELYRELT